MPARGDQVGDYATVLVDVPFCPESGRCADIAGLRIRANSGRQVRRLGESTYSALMPAALMIGYHFSTSALWKAAKAAGVNRSGGGTCMPRSAMSLCAVDAGRIRCLP